jgi:hypothetical protein
MGEEAFRAADGALREAADALAGQRRTEALLAAADRFGGSKGGRTHWLRLAEAHRDAHVTATGAVTGPKVAGKSIESANLTIGGLRLRPASASAIGEAFLATYSRARRRLAHGFQSGDMEDLHTARKHVIHHIHHLDLLRTHLSGSGKRVRALEKLREALGDLNDLDELSQFAADANTTMPDAAVKVMTKRRAVLVRRAEDAAGQLFRQKPKAFQKRIGAMWAVGKG